MMRLAGAIAAAVLALAVAPSPGFAADRPPCPQGSIASGSDSVVVEGKQAARAGDTTGCSSSVVEG
ncbi:MAG: PAAR domain-containing protein [Methyloceanibacter sp.]